MTEITVLSPHRDDAVFSLFLSLSRWALKGVPIRVLNFFTQSAYAPWAGTGEVSRISAIRAREDARSLRMVSRGLRARSLGLFDAPLRLPIAFDQVFLPETADLLSPELLATLGRHIEEFATGLVLAPLTLGDHVDHVAVLRAALVACNAKRLGFYEDLPYASWTDAHTLQRKIDEAETLTGGRLRPHVVRTLNASRRKRVAAAVYSSQITREEALQIARFSKVYGGGERIWVPQHGSWHSLLRL